MVATLGRNDSEIVFHIVDHVASPRFQEARRWLLREYSAKDYDEFIKKYPVGSDGYDNVTYILGFFETIAVLITHGLFSEDVFFDIGWGFGQYWTKVAPVMEGWRNAVSPNLWENIRWLADRSDEWAKTVWKPDLNWKPGYVKAHRSLMKTIENLQE